MKVKMNLVIQQTTLSSLRVFWGVLLPIFLSGCVNSLMRSVPNTGNSTSSPTPSGSVTAGDVLVISTITIGTGGNGGTATGTAGAPPTTNIFFDSSKSAVPLPTHCNTSAASGVATAKPCFCQFSWSEVNPNAGVGTSIPRVVKTAINVVQPQLATCPAPDVYSTEILNGTQIQITVIPGQNNADTGLFKVPPYTFTKSTSSVTGDFKDSQGHLFDNILHYSCYNLFKRGMTIQNQTLQAKNDTTGQVVNYLTGTKFCVASVAGGAPDATKCPNLPDTDFTAQSYYFNLYIRSTEVGDINQFNDGFICPYVSEGLNSNHLVGTSSVAWPLDTSFALSLSPTTTFSFGVIANTKLANGNNPNAQNSSCFSAAAGGTATGTGGGGGGEGAANAFIQSCLGFAAPMNADGTCPSFTNSSGQNQPTFRLRHYVAIYPPTFDTNGKSAGQPQSTDNIYVLDRPVKGPANSNPLKPYTMLGPKPCPFAFYDNKGVASVDINSPLDLALRASPKPAYVSSSSIQWVDKNIDGIEFPNRDTLPTDTTNAPSCSTSFPIVDRDSSFWSVGTLNINNKNHSTSAHRLGTQHQYVRPTGPFTPHYEEDTNFQACAPQANPIQDPPLHFARDGTTGRVAWCAESYPTQNNNIKKLDPPIFPVPSPSSTILPFVPTGDIAPYTSHVVKHSASHSCTFSPITFPTPTASNYDYNAAIGFNLGAHLFANHLSSVTWDDTVTPPISSDKTCDRTVANQGSVSWPRFPLLAPATGFGGIESTINQDSSYMCLVTFDNNGPKSNSKTQTTPTDGCCDKNAVTVPTGTSGNDAAHLEPDFACKTPNY